MVQKLELSLFGKKIWIALIWPLSLDTVVTPFDSQRRTSCGNQSSKFFPDIKKLPPYFQCQVHHNWTPVEPKWNGPWSHKGTHIQGLRGPHQVIDHGHHWRQRNCFHQISFFLLFQHYQTAEKCKFTRNSWSNTFLTNKNGNNSERGVW